ncbi:ABC transporter substrate-binding protein [Clostridium akagii]|uniref:ABC transporter substrate-binding protein n=1 Tax=Clostridium akagii TaxID=91623 RepID=UPI00055DF528|nr:extracellular solute-binding protein [Clostridium akagii]
MKKKALVAMMTCALVASVFVGCGSSSSSSSDKITLTVLTNRTDIADSVLNKTYRAAYLKLHPNVTLKFESDVAYDKDTETRLNSKNYGDVLLIPGIINKSEEPNYFAPLGKEKDLSKKYYGLTGTGDQFGGTIYGIPTEMNVSGIVYNKKVFKDAGITEIPTTEEDFIKDMQLIKSKTTATPYYTNYKDGWPLTQWEPDVTSVSGSASYYNVDMVNDDSPFSPGKPEYITYSLLSNLVKNKLVESDPTTSDWDKSKTGLAQGKIGAMELGCWAVGQIQSQATNKDDIGFMPFPYKVNGKSYTNMSADYMLAVSKYSKHIQESKDFVTWFIEKSGYSTYNGTINTLKSQAAPKVLSSLTDLGVIKLEPTASKSGQADWSNKIDKAGQVGLQTADFRQKIVESALGNSSDSFDKIMSDLNAKWKAGRDAVKAGN